MGRAKKIQNPESGETRSQVYLMKSKYEGASFWNPDNGEIVTLTGNLIEWFENNFATRPGYSHFFNKEEK